MRLKPYVEREGRGALSRLARESGLAYSTIQRAYDGKLIKEYDAAKKLSAATNGEVTIAELCEPPASSESGEHPAVDAEPAAEHG